MKTRLELSIHDFWGLLYHQKKSFYSLLDDGQRSRSGCSSRLTHEKKLGYVFFGDTYKSFEVVECI